MSKKRSLPSSSRGEQPPQKVRKVITNDQVALAKIFESLASDTQEVRLEAALDIVQICKNNNGEGTEPSFESARPICLRLVRGLCSSRKSARHGFFIAFVEVLRLFKSSPDLKQDCLRIIDEQTSPEDGANNREKRNYLVGNMAAHTAVIHSRLFFNGSTSQLSRFTALLNAMASKTIEYPWLREQFGTVLCQVIDMLVSDHAPSIWFEVILETLVQRNFAKTPLGIALWLEMLSKAPGIKFPKHIWRHKDPLSGQELPNSIAIMRQSTGTRMIEKAQTDGQEASGARETAPSFAWTVILDHLTPQQTPPNGGQSFEAASIKRYQAFWNEAVDANLFAFSASHEKRHLGLQLLHLQLQTHTTSVIEHLLTANIVQCLITQAAQSDRYLHGMALHILDSLATRVHMTPTLCSPLLKVFIYRKDAINFDKRSKSSFVADLVKEGLGDKHVRDNVLEIIMRAFDGFDDATEQDAVRRSQSLIELLSAVIRSSLAAMKDVQDQNGICIRSCLKVLVRRSYLDIGGTSAERLPSAMKSREAAVDALTQSLAIIVLRKDELQLSIIQETTTHIALVSSEPNELEQEQIDALKWLQNPQEHIKSKGSDGASSPSVFQWLIPLATIMIANKADDALTTFQEVQVFCTQGCLSQDDIDVLVDMLVALVAQHITLYRRLAVHAFRAINEKIGLNGLHTLFDILSKRENVSGKHDLEQDAREDEVSDVSSEAAAGQEEEDVATGMTNVELGSSDDDVEELSASDSESRTSPPNSDAESDASELARFNAVLASTLQTKRSHTNETDAPSSSDESMNDDQMLALEPELAEMFRQRLGEDASKTQSDTSRKNGGGHNKQAQAIARRNILDFKNRILDMLEIYLTQNPGLQLTFEAMIPLLMLVRTTGSKQLREKGAKILKAWQAVTKKKGGPTFTTKPETGQDKGIQQGTGWDLLEAVHAEALARPFSHMHAQLCSSTSLFIARCAMRGAVKGCDNTKTARKRMRKIEKIYAETRVKAKDVGLEQLLKTSFWREFDAWKADELTRAVGGMS